MKIPAVYSQMDSRLGNVFLGFNTQLPYNIYNFGCLITCIAMVCKYYGKEENPLSINDKLKKVNGFVSGGNYVPDAIEKIHKDITETRVMTPAPLTDFQMNEIRSALDNGYPVMIEVDYNPKTVENDMHFVLITDYNKNDENDFTIADPLGGTIKSLKSYLGWFRPSARKTINQYYIYKGVVPKTELTVTEVLNLTIDKENFEGKIKKVEFYFNEWEVEKKARLKQEDEFSKDKASLIKKYDTLRQDYDILSLSATECEKAKIALANELEEVSGNVESINKLNNQLIDENKDLKLKNEKLAGDISSLSLKELFLIILGKF